MKPKVFIGSSREGVKIANAIHGNLTREAECTVWNQGIFNLSQSTLTDLIRALRESDFGIFVFSPDDVTVMRDNVNPTVRDNVLFELGLFIGRLGPERSFFLVPDNEKDMRLPTDLAGITPGVYEGDRSDGNLYAAVGPACHQISWQMSKLKSFQDANVDEDVGGATPSPMPRKKAAATTGTMASSTAKVSKPKAAPVTRCDGEGVTATKYKNSYLLTGETKACKESLKKVGARWNQSLSGWIMSPSRMSELMHELPKITVDEHDAGE